MRMAVVIGERGEEQRAKGKEENETAGAKGREQRAERRDAVFLFALRALLSALLQFFGEGDDHSRKCLQVVKDCGNVGFDELSPLKDKQHAHTFKK